RGGLKEKDVRDRVLLFLIQHVLHTIDYALTSKQRDFVGRDFEVSMEEIHCPKRSFIIKLWLSFRHMFLHFFTFFLASPIELSGPEHSKLFFFFTTYFNNFS
ncbi:hypothetical protein ACJX0J_017095, partial [Zea mays]